MKQSVASPDAVFVVGVMDPQERPPRANDGVPHLHGGPQGLRPTHRQ